MGFVKIIPAFLLVGLVVSPAVVAQNRQEVRRHQRVSLPQASTPRPTTPRSTSTGATGTVSRSGGWRGSGVAPRSSYGRLNEGYTGYTQCRRVLSDHSRYVYSPYKLGGFDNCALFISRLWQHKGVAPGQYLWRYAQGDSPLTPERKPATGCGILGRYQGRGGLGKKSGVETSLPGASVLVAG